ncbi:hypothetical protein T484DRAFT_1843759, partial [Baffinella frigidus]
AFHVPDPTADSFLSLPDQSGTVVTSGSLPLVMDKVEIVGETAIHGDVTFKGALTIGDALAPAPLLFRGALANAFPLAFTGGAQGGRDRLLLGVTDATGDRLLTLPDASGTVLTSGNVPDVLEGTTFVGDALFRGGAIFVQEDVVIGSRESP